MKVFTTSIRPSVVAALVLSAVGAKGRKIAPLALAALALSVVSVAAHATGSEATPPDATVYAGTISGAQTYLNSLISAYGVPAILVSLAVTGLGFVWKLAKRAFH